MMGGSIAVRVRLSTGWHVVPPGAAAADEEGSSAAASVSALSERRREALAVVSSVLWRGRVVGCWEVLMLGLEAWVVWGWLLVS